MGEPGTKELLSLEDLEAAAGVRTGRKHILSILVENKPGVLTRIAGLFARRGFNIDTLAVGPTDDPAFSRITLTLDGAMHPIDQVTKQLHKLVNVLKIRDLEPAETAAREMALFKIAADGGSRGEVMQVVEIFRGKIIDVTRRALIIEVTGIARQDRGVRAHGAPVRADRDGAHGRDRDLARARRDLAPPYPEGRMAVTPRHAPLGRGTTRRRARHAPRPLRAGRAARAPERRGRARRRQPCGSPRTSTRAPSPSRRAGPASRGSASSSPTATAPRWPRSARVRPPRARPARAGSPSSPRAWRAAGRRRPQADAPDGPPGAGLGRGRRLRVRPRGRRRAALGGLPARAS